MTYVCLILLGIWIVGLDTVALAAPVLLAAVQFPARVCSARRADGQPCNKTAMKGQAVCASHGGTAPQAVAAAKRRMLAGVDRAFEVVDTVMELWLANPKLDETAPPALKAAISWLDRAGFGPTAKLEVEQKTTGSESLLPAWTEEFEHLNPDDREQVIAWLAESIEQMQARHAEIHEWMKRRIAQPAPVLRLLPGVIEGEVVVGAEESVPPRAEND